MTHQRTPMNLRLIKLLIVVASFAISFNSSATVTLEKYKDTNEVTIKVTDEIFVKDLQDFKDALQQVDDYRSVLHMNAIQLNSHGGSGTAAKEIGKILRARKLNTYLAQNDSCASACVDILIAGVMRYAFGDVLVHRTSYAIEVPNINNIAQDVEEWNKSAKEYVALMGVSSMLADAMLSTPGWKIRKLTVTEKSQWQVTGMDQLAEEIMFAQIAKEKSISRQEFVDIYTAHYDECLKQAGEFKMNVIDCAKQFKSQRITTYQYWSRRFVAWINSLDSKTTYLKSHSDRVKDIYKSMRSGRIYLRYMNIAPLATTSQQEMDKKLKPLANNDVKKIEAKNEWWVNKNNLSILLVNQTDQDIKKITFSLSNSYCDHPSKKVYLSLDLTEPLDRYRTVVYSGSLPFDYHKEYGAGERCGIVEEAFWIN